MLNAKNKIRYLFSIIAFDLPQRKANGNSHYFQNWHILIYNTLDSLCSELLVLHQNNNFILIRIWQQTMTTARAQSIKKKDKRG